MTIPADAERMSALDHMEFVRMPSRFAPGAEQIKPVLTCPGCQRRSPAPTHCELFACDCGLTMQIDGSVLRVWREPVSP